MISYPGYRRPARAGAIEPAPAHPQEVERLASLCGLMLLEGESEPLFDGVARRAAELCGAPVGLVTALRGEDQLFLGREGTSVWGNARDESFCAHTILGPEPLMVPDTRLDPRFATLSVVAGDPFIRFYAGATIVDADGLPLGTVCVLDVEAREASPETLAGLQRLAALVGDVLEARRLALEFLGPEPTPFELMRALDRMTRILEPFLARDGFLGATA